MRLSRTNAEKIVKELNTVIDQSVNMMNEEGIIIASTDQERVGQIHEGARKIIEQNLEELVIRPEDVYGGQSGRSQLSDYDWRRGHWGCGNHGTGAGSGKVWTDHPEDDGDSYAGAVHQRAERYG